MLRLYDTRTGRVEAVRPVPGSQLRVLTRSPCGERGPFDDARLWLVADLLRRRIEWTGVPVEVCAVADPPATLVLRGADHAALNIYPADRTAAPDGPTPSGISVGGHVLARPGPIAFRAASPPSGAQPTALGGLAVRGLDPLALRLAFLQRRYREPLDLTWDALRTSDGWLRRWRRRVADWARSPSAPVARRYVDAVTAAFDDDLDTPAALRHLLRLESDETVPPGARFETFAALDRLFGLDLAADVGKPAPSSGR